MSSDPAKVGTFLYSNDSAKFWTFLCRNDPAKVGTFLYSNGPVKFGTFLYKYDHIRSEREVSISVLISFRGYHVLPPSPPPGLEINLNRQDPAALLDRPNRLKIGKLSKEEGSNLL